MWIRRGADAAAEQSKTSHYVDYRELLETEIDAVVICSPNTEHKQHAIAAAQAGKHILCEKPISVNVADDHDRRARAGVVLQTAFPVRHVEPVRRLKAAVDQGKLGEIIAINTTNHGKMPPGWFLNPARAGGGAVMDHTVHVADIVRWILKTEFTQVYAEVDTLLHDVGIDDCGMLTMELASGAIMSLDPSTSRPDTFPTWGDVTMELIGTKGVASLDAFHQAGMLYVTGNPSSPGGVYENSSGQRHRQRDDRILYRGCQRRTFRRAPRPRRPREQWKPWPCAPTVSPQELSRSLCRSKRNDRAAAYLGMIHPLDRHPINTRCRSQKAVQSGCNGRSPSVQSEASPSASTSPFSCSSCGSEPVIMWREELWAALTGLVLILAIFGSVLLHEFGHAIAARRFGVRTPDITCCRSAAWRGLSASPTSPGRSSL